MTIPERTVSIAGAFAEDAATTIPTPPVAGTAYRDTTLTTSEAKEGWPYKEIVDSSKFNQAMYEYSTISQMIEKYGFLPWSANTDYEQGSYSLGTDGTIYRAVQASGPSSTAYNPVNDTSHTYWETWLDSMDLMIGDIKASVRTANHGSWLLCNGQAVSRTTYSKLFSIIGTNFGSGNGSTTFNVPDYRGKFLRGLGGNSAGNMQTTQAEGLPNITGKCTPWIYNLALAVKNTSGAFKVTETSVNLGNNNDLTRTITGSNNIDFNASRSNSIYGASSHVTPINMAVNYFIRAK